MLAFVAMSCEEIQDFIDPKGHGLVFLEGEMKAYFDDKGDTKNYKFKADLAWSAEVSADWVEVNPTSGPAGENKIKIKVDKNKSDEKRTGYVDITLSNDKSYRIELEQLASGENLDDVIPSISIPSNEIWYTNGNTTEPTTPDNTDVFGANIVSNTFDAKKECWVIKFDGDVTTIGNYAFHKCSSLTSVTIPDSVTTIGERAFSYCSSLASVTIPDSVTTIGDWAFSYCSSLTSVTIGDSVTTIGEGAFGDCSSLTSVTIPDSVTTIGVHAFRNCSSLTSVTIGDSVTIIEGYAFTNCTSLTSVTIPDSVTTIGEAAFWECNSLTSVTIGDSVTTIGDGAFDGCSSLNAVHVTDLSAWCRIDFTHKFSNPLTFAHNLYLNSELVADLTIPSDITVIKDYAFFSGNSIHNINLHNGITSVGIGAFVECRIQSVTIPDSITEIKDAAFTQCLYLTEFRGKFATEDGLALIVDGRFHAFACGSGVTEYTIPEGVVAIGECAFNKSYSLTSVIIPNSVVEIDADAFRYSKNLTSITIPDSVTSIGARAFQYCSGLTSVTIPDSITTIGYAALRDCDSLTNVYCKAINPPTTIVNNNGYWYGFAKEDESGNICNIDCTIYVPAESVNAYKSAEGWSAYADAIVGYEFGNGEVVVPDTDPSKSANNEIWYTNGSTTEATTPRETNVFGANIVSNTYDAAKECWVIKFDSDVTTIGGYAFAFCYDLTSVTIPNSVTEIEEEAFYGCSSLTSVTIPDSVTTIGDYAFSWCESLTSVTIPDSVTTIGDYAFYSCESLTSVTIPDSVTEIGFCAFWDCSSLQEFNGKFASEDGRCLIVDGILNSFAPAGLTEYTIPNSVTKIGNHAFCNCKNLTSVTIPDSVTEIGSFTFSCCDKLTSVTIPDSVTAIGECVFDGCSSLTSVTIGDSVATIGNGAFRDCSSLTSVYCKATTPSTGGFWMFDNNASGRTIYVPMESVEAYKSAEGWCDYADAIVGYDF